MEVVMARLNCLLLLLSFVIIGCGSVSPFVATSARIAPVDDGLPNEWFAMQINDQIDRATSPDELQTQVGDAGIERLSKIVAILEKRAALYSENIANVATLAYKRQYVVQASPTSIQVRFDQAQGPMQNTGRQLDVAISGAGLFQVKVATGDGVAYTRSGNFFINQDHELVVGDLKGPRLSPPITVPENVTDVSIAEDGTVQAIVAGSNTPQDIGQLELKRFVNPQALKLIGPNLYAATPEAGEEIQSAPAHDGAGTILQNVLEASNVEMTREMLELVRVARQHELIQRLISRYEQNPPAIATGN